MKNRLKIILIVLLPLAAQSTMATPEIQHWQNQYGNRVYFVEAPEVPMLDIRLTFDAGSARDGAQYGIASFVSGMIEEGAAGMSAEEIALGFEEIGARFSMGATRDNASISLRTLTETELQQRALLLFSKVISQVEFPESAVERVRAQIITSLNYAAQSPGKIAVKEFYRRLYGDHPYAHPTSGDSKHINAISTDDLKQFYRRHYQRQNVMIAMVGAISRSEAEAIANQITVNLPDADPLPPLAAVNTTAKMSTTALTHSSTQTHIMVGQLGYKRGDEDKYPLYVGNHILGGSGLTSIISDEIREKRGLSYSAYSYFAPMRDFGPFLLSLQTKNSKKSEALQVLKETLHKFRSEGPTEDQLEAAKRNITGGFPLKIDSNSDILGYIAMIGTYGLPLDYLDQFTGRVEAVTREQIRNAFQRRVDPDKMVQVMVGGE